MSSRKLVTQWQEEASKARAEAARLREAANCTPHPDRRMGSLSLAHRYESRAAVFELCAKQLGELL